MIPKGASTDTYVSSAKWKWAILFSCFVTKILNPGLRKSFGVLLLTLESQFETDVWLLGMVVSVMISIGDFTGPISGGFANRYGCRVVVMLGGVSLCFGMIVASFSTSVVQLTAFLCVFCGPGFGMTNDVPFAALGQYFHQDFGIVNSFAMTGASVGYILLGPLTQLFIEVYGWRGTMLLLGGTVFHIAIAGALLRPNGNAAPDQERAFPKAFNWSLLPEDDADTPDDKDDKEINDKSIKTANWWSDCGHSIVHSLDCSLFKDPMFIVIVVVTTTIRFTQMAWLLYLVPNVVSKGVPKLQASFISTTAGVGDGIGRLLPGVIMWISGSKISSRTVWTLGMVTTSVSLALDAVVESYTGMLILGSFQGLGLGMMYSSTNVVLFDEFGKERLVNSMGWIRGISGLGRVVGGTIPGWIYHVTNSYRWSYVTLGCIQALGIAVLYIGQFFVSSKHHTTSSR